jgi:hypothetical protein
VRSMYNELHTMDVKPIEELIIDPNNPRIVSDFQGNNLANGMTKYGDLAPIVFNRKLGKLVGGNTRTRIITEKLLGQNRVVYTTKYDQPDEQGTVALGHVWHNNTPFAYREVEFDEVIHREANIASNAIHGDFVDQLLAEANQFIMENNGDVFATGQTEEDINKLLEQVGPSLDPEPGQSQQKQDDGMQRLKLKFTEEQYDVVYQAIGIMKHERQLTRETNPDLDANALYYICRAYAETHTSQNEQQASDTPDQATETPQPDLTAIPAN